MSLSGDSNKHLHKKPKVGIGFWLLWIICLCVFLVGVGCSLFGVSFFIDSFRRSFKPEVFVLIIPAGALYLLVYSLVQAFKKQKQGIPTLNLLPYVLWLPLLAVFLWGGGCLLSIIGF